MTLLQRGVRCMDAVDGLLRLSLRIGWGGRSERGARRQYQYRHRGKNDVRGLPDPDHLISLRGHRAAFWAMIADRFEVAGFTG
jgi:hypothetical protein